MAESNGNRSVERTFAIIECMTQESESALTELARKTGLSKATVYRMLSTLMGLGYVTRDAKTEKYRLTLKFLQISANKLMHYDIQRQMHPILEQIASTTGETVHLVERSDDTVVYIDKCESTTNSVRMVSRIGMSLDLFSTGVGKALLAHLPDEEITNLWSRCSHNRKTPFTITELPDFLREIAVVRQQGYAVDNEENELDVRCVAVAAADLYGQFRYAVSISAPKSRADDKAILERADLLKKSIRN